MKYEDNFATYEQYLEMSKEGYPQKGCFYWGRTSGIKPFMGNKYGELEGIDLEDFFIAATVSEMAEYLRKNTKEGKWELSYYEQEFVLFNTVTRNQIQGSNLAQAYAAACIFVLKQSKPQ